MAREALPWHTGMCQAELTLTTGCAKGKVPSSDLKLQRESLGRAEYLRQDLSLCMSLASNASSFIICQLFILQDVYPTLQRGEREHGDWELAHAGNVGHTGWNRPEEAYIPPTQSHRIWV